LLTRKIKKFISLWIELARPEFP